MHYDKFPKDSFMLLSFINMKLRDEYSSLANLCQAFQENQNDVKEKLKDIDYVYDQEHNQFVSK